MMYTIHIEKKVKAYCVYLMEQNDVHRIKEEDFDSELDAYRFAVRLYNGIKGTLNTVSGIFPMYDIVFTLAEGQKTLDEFNEGI